MPRVCQEIHKVKYTLHFVWFNRLWHASSFVFLLARMGGVGRNRRPSCRIAAMVALEATAASAAVAAIAAGADTSDARSSTRQGLYETNEMARWRARGERFSGLECRRNAGFDCSRADTCIHNVTSIPSSAHVTDAIRFRRPKHRRAMVRHR
jgi:hypothetical protein